MAEDRQIEEADGAGGTYLFAGIQLGGPLEELDAAAARKVEMFTRLGDEENARTCSRAHELARARLQAVLEARRTAAGT